MRVCARGGQMVMTTTGAFAAFSLMTVAVGTDFWLYSRGDCQTKNSQDNDTHKNEEVLTHSGLWRTCCMEGTYIGVCKTIDHFPEESDYEQDAGEFILRAVRASSVFPILSVCLQFTGGVCVAASEFYKTKYNVILSAGILFISAGLSNIIGIIVYISAAAGDPNQSESKRSHWYGWSFYCGAFSFVATEMVGVATIHLFIDVHRRLRAANPSAHTRAHARALTHTNSHSSYTHNNHHGGSLSRSRHPSGTRNSSYRSRYRRQPSYRSSPAAAAPPTLPTAAALWRPPITADVPGWPLYAMGYPHTHSAPDGQNAVHAESDADANHTHLNSLRRNNSCPQTLSDEALALALATHTHVLTHVQSDGSLANPLTHTHYDPHAHSLTLVHTLTQTQNHVQSGGANTHTCDAEDVTHTLTHTGNNITHTAHAQNSVQSHTHDNSTLDNTHTYTHTHEHEHEHAHMNSVQDEPHTGTHTYAYTNNCAQENAHLYTHTHAHNSIQENSLSAARRTTPV